jgi:hypothetical protein
MGHRLHRALTAGAVLAAAAGGLAVTAPPAQAATATHCPTANSAPLLPSGTGYLFPFITASVSACGFVDNGAPYTFTIDTATSTVVTPTGTHTYVVHNISLTCTAVKVSGDSLLATGCLPA